MHVIVDGLLTHYERLTDGRTLPVIVILPGWADTSRSWTAVAEPLAKRYDVITLDLPGFGGSQMPPQAWNLDDYVQFVHDFLDKLGIMDIYALIGHSNGGAMAIKAVAQGAVRPKKLVLLASAGIRGTQKGCNFGLKLLAKSGKLATRPLPKSLQKSLRARLYKAAGSDLLVAEHMQETFKKIVTEDVRAEAGRITTQTLLIYGDADTETPVAYGDIYHEHIQSSRLEIMPSAGHFLHVQQAAALAQEVEEFLV